MDDEDNVLYPSLNLGRSSTSSKLDEDDDGDPRPAAKGCRNQRQVKQ